jgi:hypothetical protein
MRVKKTLPKKKINNIRIFQGKPRQSSGIAMGQKLYGDTGKENGRGHSFIDLSTFYLHS